ncbi:MAG: hypothetical protein V1736_08815 [Pseudomonadota bacterium]
MGALSVGDVRTGTIPSLLPSQKHYLKVYGSVWFTRRIPKSNRHYAVNGVYCTTNSLK